MAASLASGKTTIYNAACEPYIQQLCRLLVGMGADIEGIGSNLLTVHGVDRLHGASHKILPDMIEVGSFIGMAAITRSEITIKDTSYSNLGIIPESFRRIGVKLEQHGDDILVPRQDSYEIESFMDGSIMTIADAPWPGLTPDLLSVFLVVATQCKGSVLIHQKMFESRLFFVDRLIDMGAQIILCDPHRAVVIGHDHNFRLRAGNMLSPDIPCLHFDNPDDPQSVEMIGSIKERGVEGTIVKYSGILPGDPVLDEIAAAYREVEAF